jgi:hypothetical protein
MATGTNGIATTSELMYGKGLSPPSGYSSNQCPPKSVILSMGGTITGSYQANQLVKYSDVTIDGVLFTVTIDNRNSTVATNLYVANRAAVAPGVYAFRTKRRVGYTSSKGVTNHNTGPFNVTEIYGNSNVLLWTGPVGFNYSYSAIVGTSGTTYSPAGSGTYNGTNADTQGDNLEYITLFSQSINNGDSISLSIIIY